MISADEADEPAICRYEQTVDVAPLNPFENLPIFAGPPIVA
jgi:hypothetical protein